MTNYTVNIHNSAKSDLKKLKRSHLKETLLNIIDTLKNDPYEHSQSFEKIQPKHLGRYLRRLNHQHRVVYRIDEDNKEVLILSAWSHCQ
ncbi:addiction module toxin, Txe/YoeB family (plasmid) [Staphylococcus capitis subsp. capitis]|jgi:toxin YoeB|uniref:Txe/YoeB family addiction module toxin n=1 Tax=Staphylococcus capitis TaxID=29388 RepID=UPI00064B2D21|nr:Txe/YoeB family addiction module toxin [Staphylococcus capitis]AKL93475.1 addiction module toxin, Txe/YoeB family [Staphylococcus capitis subsp. capitis]